MDVGDYVGTELLPAMEFIQLGLPNHLHPQ